MSGVYNGNIDIFNPFAEQILERGIDETFSKMGDLWGPFLQLLGLRWLSVVENDPYLSMNTLADIRDAKSEIVVTHDWFLGLSDQDTMEKIKNYDGKIIVFGDLPSNDLKRPFYPAAMNTFIADPDPVFDVNNLYYYHCSSRFLPLPIVKMGCSSAWLPHINHCNKVIFLDEPHPTVIESMERGNHLRGEMYCHALKVCRILANRGYHILSFCREQSSAVEKIFQENDFIEKIDVGRWIPFKELVSYYGRSSLFFSFFHETHGYSLYENLQLGSGLVVYSEYHDPYSFRNFQNAAMLSVNLSPALAASIIEEFYDHYIRYNLRETIRQRANDEFSCETFSERMRSALSLYLD